MAPWLIVVTTLGNQNGLILQLINQAMLVRDAARPVALQAMFKGFGLTHPFKRGSHGSFNQLVD